MAIRFPSVQLIHVIPVQTDNQEKYGTQNYAFPLLYILSCVIYFEFISDPMQLMMYIGNDLIESVPLDTERISQPGYLGQFKRVLKEKYAQLIRESSIPPEFIVVNLKSNTESNV